MMINLRNFDLNLLVAFNHLMQELSVSRAAEKMYVTQSAMSHILQRLRQQLDDPLLIKTSSGMKPTERALQLILPVRGVLQDVERLIMSRQQFSPETSQHRFCLVATDYIEYLLLPSLVRRISLIGPKIQIQVQRPWDCSIESQLENNEIDVILGFEAILKLPGYACSQRLFDDTMACIVRENHPQVGDDLSLDEYVCLEHMLISRCGLDSSIVDKWLATIGLERRVQVIVPYFLSAPFIVSTTDLVLSLPRRIAEKVAKASASRMVKVPFDLPTFDVVMAWHPLKDKDPANAWLRRQISAVSEQLDLEPPESGFACVMPKSASCPTPENTM